MITREFIDALNLTDLNGAIEWTVDTNVNNDNGANLTFASNVTYTTRGVGASTPQRNFFPFYVNFDSYNLERYDFSRGPNSVLFGNGNQAGSANVVTKQARFDRPVRELRTSFGSWSTRRVSVDVNQPLNDRLAVRANAVWQNGRGWRDRDFSKLKGLALTGSLRLAPNTQLRFEGEYGETAVCPASPISTTASPAGMAPHLSPRHSLPRLPTAMPRASRVMPRPVSTSMRPPPVSTA